MRYEIQLTELRVKPHQTTALHLMTSLALFAVGAVSSVLYWFTNISPGFKKAYSPFGIFGLLSMLAGILVFAIAIFNKKWLRRPKANLILRLFELVLLLGGAGIFYWSGWKIPAAIFGVLGLAVLFAVFWEQGGEKPREVVINDKGVRLPFALRGRSLEWWEVEQVLLRHGVLTIDCFDNHLYQWNVRTPGFSPAQFEEDCALRIAASAAERKKNNW